MATYFQYNSLADRIFKSNVIITNDMLSNFNSQLGKYNNMSLLSNTFSSIIGYPTVHSKTWGNVVISSNTQLNKLANHGWIMVSRNNATNHAIIIKKSTADGWDYKRFPTAAAINEYVRNPKETYKKWSNMLQVLVKNNNGKDQGEIQLAKGSQAEFNRLFKPARIIRISGPNGSLLYINTNDRSAFNITALKPVYSNSSLLNDNPIICNRVLSAVNRMAATTHTGWFKNLPQQTAKQALTKLNDEINREVTNGNKSTQGEYLLVLDGQQAARHVLGFDLSIINKSAIDLIEEINAKDRKQNPDGTWTGVDHSGQPVQEGNASDGMAESENTQKEIDDKIKGWTEELMSTLGEDDKISTQPSTIFTGNGLSVYEAAMHDASTSNINLSSSILSPTATYGIGGMPASYLATTDPPTWTSGAGNRCGIGLTYLEHYIRYGNFIAFRPCVTRYATDLASTLFEKHDLSNAVKDIFDRTIAGTLTTLEPRLTEYWSQVSRLCRQAIFLMGIENDVIDFEVGNIKLNNLQKTRSQKDGVNFATTNQFEFKGINGDAWMTVGMAFSNFIGNKQPNQQTIFSGMDPETLNSMDSTSDCGIVTFYASKFESSNDITNETGTSKMGEAVSNALGDTNQILKKFLESSFGLGQPGSSDNLFNLLTGNYMIPKTYTGTSFSKSYGAEFKFVSAAGDPVSVFLNCIFPIIKLLALTYPESTGGLLFTPWIVNVFSSGHMNIDYGMISSMRVRRNSIAVSDSGLATEFEVTINIDDLKPFTFLEKPKWWTYTSETSGSMGIMLATLVGQNLTTIPYANKRDFRRRLGAMNMQEVVDDMGDDAKQSINRFISRHLRSITNRGYSTADKARAINMIRKELMYGRNQHQNFSK